MKQSNITLARSEIRFIVLEKNHFEDYNRQILDFYENRFVNPFTQVTIDNSALICLAMDGKNIVGALRVISDLTRHAEIVDLNVRKAYRRQKVGTRLIQLALDYLVKNKVNNIGLTTEHGVDWLPDFYKKIGFTELENSVYLEYNTLKRDLKD